MTTTKDILAAQEESDLLDWERYKRWDEMRKGAIKDYLEARKRHQMKINDLNALLKSFGHDPESVPAIRQETVKGQMSIREAVLKSLADGREKHLHSIYSDITSLTAVATPTASISGVIFQLKKQNLIRRTRPRFYQLAQTPSSVVPPTAQPTNC